MHSNPKSARLKDEFESDPLLRMMFKAAMGQASAEEIATWRQIARMFTRLLPKIETMLARYKPEEHAAKLQQLLDGWIAEECATRPTWH